MPTTVGADRESVLEATRGITDLIEANAPAGERGRRLEPDSVAAIKAAGVWRILSPSRYGGSELDMRTQWEAIATLAEAHSAAGWLAVVLGAHTWMMGSWPEICQQELFADDPDVLIPGTLAAQGTAREVDGGWRVSGRWQFASGVDHGHWLMVGAHVEGVDVVEHPAEAMIHVVLPIEDAEIDDTWYVMGLRATGSKDVVLDDVLIPEHRGVSTLQLMAGSSPHAEDHATGIYRLPFMGVLPLFLSGAHVGIAKRALRLHVERTKARSDVYTKASTAQKPGQQMRVAEASAEIASAQLLLEGVCDKLDAIAREGRLATIEERVEIKWHVVYGSELCRRATERIFRAAGAHGIYDLAEIQATFRDINTACHHGTLDFDSMAQTYGSVALGLEPAAALF